MKTLSVLTIVLLAGLAIPFARGARSPDRPPGVTEEAWAPMGDSAGFVITRDAGSPVVLRDRTALFPQPSLRGYFVVKRASTWFRVEAQSELRIEPANSTP